MLKIEKVGKSLERGVSKIAKRKLLLTLGPGWASPRGRVPPLAPPQHQARLRQILPGDKSSKFPHFLKKTSIFFKFLDQVGAPPHHQPARQEGERRKVSQPSSLHFPQKSNNIFLFQVAEGDGEGAGPTGEQVRTLAF